MMTAVLEIGDVIKEVWVFDAFVVVRTEALNLRFFEKPTIQAYFERSMTLDLNDITMIT